MRPTETCIINNGYLCLYRVLRFTSYPLYLCLPWSLPKTYVLSSSGLKLSPPLRYFHKILQSLENGVVAFVGCECSSGMHVRGSVDDRGANVILTVRDPAASGKPRPHSLHSGPDGAENNGHRDMRHC